MNYQIATAAEIVLTLSISAMAMVYFGLLRIRTGPGRVTLARSLLTSFGVSVAILGYWLFLQGTVFEQFVGAAIGVAGIQIGLWSIGVRTFVLGTRSIDAPSDSQTEPTDKGLVNYRILAESDELYAPGQTARGTWEQVSFNGLIHIARMSKSDPQVQSLALRAALLREQLGLRRAYSKPNDHLAREDDGKLVSGLADTLAQLRVELALRGVLFASEDVIDTGTAPPASSPASTSRSTF